MGLILIKNQTESKATELESRVEELQSTLIEIQCTRIKDIKIIEELKSTCNQLLNRVSENESKISNLETKVEENQSRVSNLESRVIRNETFSLPLWKGRWNKMNEENMTEIELKVLKEHDN